MVVPNDKKDELLDPAKTPIVQQWFSRRPPSAEDEYFEEMEMRGEHLGKEELQQQLESEEEEKESRLPPSSSTSKRPKLRVIRSTDRFPFDNVPSESGKQENRSPTGEEAEPESNGFWQRVQQWISRVLSKGPGDQWRP